MIDVLQLARKAAEGRHAVSEGDAHSLRFDELERFADLVLEEAAKVCDAKVDAKYATGIVDIGLIRWTQSCAEDIRSLKPKGEA